MNGRHGGSPDSNACIVRKHPYRINVRFHGALRHSTLNFIVGREQRAFPHQSGLVESRIDAVDGQCSRRPGGSKAYAKGADKEPVIMIFDLPEDKKDTNK